MNVIYVETDGDYCQHSESRNNAIAYGQFLCLLVLDHVIILARYVDRWQVVPSTSFSMQLNASRAVRNGPSSRLYTSHLLYHRLPDLKMMTVSRSN